MRIIYLTGLVLSLMSMPMIATRFLYGAMSDDSEHHSEQPGAALRQTDGSALKGTWSGNFQSASSNRNAPAINVTVEIGPDSTGHLVGHASLDSGCLKQAKLQVTTENSNVVLAGGDAKGDNITIRGTIDDSGTFLKVKYIVNGSASTACELDTGAGTLAKR